MTPNIPCSASQALRGMFCCADGSLTSRRRAADWDIARLYRHGYLRAARRSIRDDRYHRDHSARAQTPSGSHQGQLVDSHCSRRVTLRQSSGRSHSAGPVAQANRRYCPTGRVVDTARCRQRRNHHTRRPADRLAPATARSLVAAATMDQAHPTLANQQRPRRNTPALENPSQGRPCPPSR